MSDITTPSSPTPDPPAAAWPFPRRLVAVFTSPRLLFEHLADRPSWLLPFLILLVGAAVFVQTTWDNAWLPEMMNKMEEQGAGEQAFDMITNTGKMMYTVIIPLFGGLFTLLYGLAVMFVGNFVLGGKLGFRHAMSVVSQAGLVSLVALPIRVLLANAASSPQVTLGPGALLPVAQQEGFVMKFLAFFLQSFDLFTLWQTALVAIGISVVARVGVQAAMIAIFGLFVVFSLLGALMGAAFGG
jgi:hypothetical protein